MRQPKVHDHGFEIMWGPCPICGIDWRETDADHPESTNPQPIIEYPETTNAAAQPLRGDDRG